MELTQNGLSCLPDCPKKFDAFFRKKYNTIAGADEAGRGPLAGPVVAAAVILDEKKDYPGVTDSKKMTAKGRDKAYELIISSAAAWACEIIDAEEVDKLNPLGASLLAMERAVAALSISPGLVLVDGNAKPRLPMPCETIVKGDFRSLSIAAASILAKVTRDRIMLEMDMQYPQYGFKDHKGYGVPAHLKALARHGPCPCHRLSFAALKLLPNNKILSLSQEPSMSEDKRHILGRKGEDLAEEHLKTLGYKIEGRNIFNEFGEIDIVALDGPTVVIVEVKTRSRHGRAPSEAVNYRKQNKLSLTATMFLSQRGWNDKPARFDVVEVISTESSKAHIKHIKNAFDSTL